MPRLTRRRLALPALALVGLFSVSACLGDGAPTPSPAPSDEATAAPTEPPTPTPTARTGRDRQALVVMAPEHPRRLLPGDNLNVTEQLLVDVLYDPLYRLDEDQRPVPELARDLPQVSADGKTWTIELRRDAAFHSGEKVRADDVIFSLALAKSPSCSLGRELCATVRDHLDTAERDENVVKLQLNEPHAPFLAEALARLPVFSAADVRRATGRLIDAADRLNEQRPSNVVADITDQVRRDACFEPDPPRGCRLVDHRQRLENIFQRARLDLPSQLPFTDETGLFDEDGYTGELLERLSDLDRTFTTEASDKRSAALGLLDVTVRPFGSGPFRLVQSGEEDGVWVLRANRDHTRSAPKIERLEIHVERDPSVATARLLAGDADWVLEVGPQEAAVIDEAPGYAVAPRPLDRQWGILFNLRTDRLYFDVRARRAFALCIDQEGLGTALDPDRPLAGTPYNAGSWAEPEWSVGGRNVDAANALLEEAGWQMAVDGIRQRDGVRLSSTIAVRPTSVDLFTFANQAADQLKECGIELEVDELDLTGSTMLDQLQHPNDFDTLLWQRTLTTDPDSAVRVFESSRVTGADNEADENPSGFTSELVDLLVQSARETVDLDERMAAYAEIDTELDTLLPYWPLWYSSTVSAVSDRLRDSDGPLDPASPRYAWDLADWELERDPG